MITAFVENIDTLVCKHLLEDGRALIMILDQDYKLYQWRGDHQHYELNLTVGKEMEGALPFLGPHLSLSGEYEFIPNLTLQNGRSVHVHLIQYQGFLGVVFLDAQEAHDQLQKSQQVSHELQLLQRCQSTLLVQLQEAHTKLESTNKALTRANDGQSRFIASMSHEFRTPLTSVVGYTELLQRLVEAPPKAVDYLTAIEQSAKYLLVLIDNLLDRALMDADELEIIPVRVKSKKLFDDIIQLLRPLASRKGLELHLELSTPLPPYIIIDDVRLHQVLINLVGNGIKFTEQGSVRIVVAREKEHLQVAVHDSGPGIDPEVGESIFDAFQQGNTGGDEGTQVFRGAGLGLSISRDLVARMNGVLGFDSTLGEGSCFFFTIPAPEAQQTVRKGEGPAGCVSKKGAKPANASLLVAEDDPDIRGFIEAALEPIGYELRFAENGFQAVQDFIENKPDLVLMDMHMPVMDGKAAAKVMRKQGYEGPLIALSAASSKITRDQALGAGCDDYLVKPLSIEQLRITIQNYLNQ